MKKGKRNKKLYLDKDAKPKKWPEFLFFIRYDTNNSNKDKDNNSDPSSKPKART